MTTETVTASLAGRVTQVLDEFFDRQDNSPLTQAIRRFAATGKRLRPAFCYWGWRGAAASAGDDEPAVIAGAALEMFHCFALIHDDIIDQSSSRRGRPSCHEEFAQWHAAQGLSGDPAHFGRSAALLCGDLCASWAVELFEQCCERVPVDRAVVARQLFALARAEAIAGEFMDITADIAADDAVEVALDVSRFKTARYSISRPLQIGAVLAGADPRLLNGLARFGDQLGEAFQLRDDVLGVFGDPRRTGKSTETDLQQGKPTVLLALTLRLAGRAQATRILDLVRQRGFTQTEASLIRRTIVSTGALAETERQIAIRRDAALQVLDSLQMDNDARVHLRELAEAATTRRG